MITFDARAISFPVVQARVLDQHPDLAEVFQDFTVSNKAPRKDRYYICETPTKHPLAISLKPSDQFLQKLQDQWVVRSKRMQKYVRIHHAFPQDWRGMCWMSRQNLKDLERRGLGHLLDTNYVHPEDVSAYMTFAERGLRIVDGRLASCPPKARFLHKGVPTLSLRKAMDRVPYGASMRCTTGGFPYSCVNRGYLEYLVYDGSGPGFQMKTAEETVPGANAMRDSLLVYLKKTNFIDRLMAKTPAPGTIVRDGKPTAPQNWKTDPVVTAPIRKQWERIDIPSQRDLEWNPFCTFGYYEGDSFVASGLPYRMPFQSHGVPTWIKRPMPEGEEKSPDFFEPMEQWERALPWKPAEEVEPFRPFVAPQTHAARVRWCWNLSRDVGVWKDRWLHHLSVEDQERSESDQARYQWDRDELATELESKRHQFDTVLAAGGESLKRDKCVRRVRKELKAADRVHDDQEIRARHLANCILEWMTHVVTSHRKDKEFGTTAARKDAEVLQFNLLMSKRVRSAKRFRRAMQRLRLEGRGAERSDLVVQMYGHSAASCWEVQA